MAALELNRVRRDVEALAAMERRSASAGERASAQWLAGRLSEAGAHDVRLQAFRYPHTYAHAQALLYAAGIAAARAGGLAGLATAATAGALLDLDYSGRAQPLRDVLPAGEGTNVVARVPARGEPRRRLVLVAHHDAAHTGLVWHPRMTALATRGAAETGEVPSFVTAPTLALAAVAAGSLVPGRAGRLLRGAGAATLAATLGLVLDVARGETIPGASDNAAGVAVVLALAERFAREPLDDVELTIVLPGCEESGMGGMRAWMRAEGAALDPASTFVLGVDTPGAGAPVVLTGEGPPRTVRYRDEDVAWVDRGAERAGLEPPRRYRMGGYTDPVLARLAGLPTVSILSIDPELGLFRNYHLPSDDVEHVDWDSLERCARIAEGTVLAWAQG